MKKRVFTALKPVGKSHPVKLFIKKVSVTFAVLLAVGIFAVYFLIYLPLNNALEKSLISNFGQLSTVNYNTFRNGILKCTDNSKNLSGSFVMSEVIINYNNAEISIEELTLSTQPLFSERVKGMENLVSAQRFVDDVLVAKHLLWGYGVDFFKNSEMLNSRANKNKQVDSSILLIDDGIYCIVKSFIIRDMEQLGYDLLIFNLTENVRILSSDIIKTSIIDGSAYKTLVTDSAKLRNYGEMLMANMPDNFYAMMPLQENVYFVSKQSKKLLFSSVNHLSAQACIVFVSILLIYIIAVYFNIVRVAKKELRNLEVTNIALGKAASEVNVDSLTKAGSRRYGTQFLEKMFSNFKLGAPSPIIIMFDIDLFKQINDNYGHYTGDEVLKQVVNAIRKSIRNEDRLFRWGGDEFVGVFFGVEKENAGLFADKMLNTVLGLEIDLEGENIKPTVSIGISYFKPSDTEFSEAVNRADRAMYLSKAGDGKKVNIL